MRHASGKRTTGVDAIWVLEVCVVELPELEAWIVFLIVLEAAHILCLLLHSRTNGFDGDKDADFCIVLIHHVAESAYLRNGGFTGFDFGKDSCVCLFHLLWIPERHMSDTVESTVADIFCRSQSEPCYCPIREVVILAFVSFFQKSADFLHVCRVAFDLVVY